MKKSAVKYTKKICKGFKKLYRICTDREIHGFAFKLVRKSVAMCFALCVLGSAVFFAIQDHITQSVQDYIVTLETSPSADAVMVLGALVYSGGNPSPMLADRLDYGYELYIRGKAKKYW